MKPHPFRKTNHRAVAGFLCPFLAAGVAGFLVLMGREDFTVIKYSISYLTVVPAILLSGLILSLKSIPLIREFGDRDYAYSGLTMNILFIFIYIISVIYFLFPASR
jgi:hypothetical protein